MKEEYEVIVKWNVGSTRERICHFNEVMKDDDRSIKTQGKRDGKGKDDKTEVKGC